MDDNHDLVTTAGNVFGSANRGIPMYVEVREGIEVHSRGVV